MWYWPLLYLDKENEKESVQYALGQIFGQIKNYTTLEKIELQAYTRQNVVLQLLLRKYALQRIEILQIHQDGLNSFLTDMHVTSLSSSALGEIYEVHSANGSPKLPNCRSGCGPPLRGCLIDNGKSLSVDIISPLCRYTSIAKSKSSRTNLLSHKKQRLS